MSDEMIPSGVALTLALFQYDLRKGVNGYTGEPMHPKIARLDAMTLHAMGTLLLSQLKTFFDADFAEAVVREYNGGAAPKGSTPSTDAMHESKSVGGTEVQ